MNERVWPPKPAEYEKGPDLTNAQFARYVSYLAATAAKWAAEVLDMPEAREEPISPWSAGRFIDDIRDRINHIEAQVKRP